MVTDVGEGWWRFCKPDQPCCVDAKRLPDGGLVLRNSNRPTVQLALEAAGTLRLLQQVRAFERTGA